MTDGAARVCQLLLTKAGGGAELARELQEAFVHLTSRDPSLFWTSGQARPVAINRQLLPGATVSPVDPMVFLYNVG